MTTTTTEATAGDPIPGGGPATLTAVRVQLGIKDGDTRDDDKLRDVIAGVNAYVRRLPSAVDDIAEGWADDIVLGAVMLAARIFRRKNTPAGADAVAASAAPYVARNDPEIAMLLGIGDFAKPKAR
jgi:hypothetical protein